MLELRYPPAHRLDDQHFAAVREIIAEVLEAQQRLGYRASNQLIIDKIGLDAQFVLHEDYWREALDYYLGLLYARIGELADADARDHVGRAADADQLRTLSGSALAEFAFARRRCATRSFHRRTVLENLARGRRASGLRADPRSATCGSFRGQFEQSNIRRTGRYRLREPVNQVLRQSFIPWVADWIAAPNAAAGLKIHWLTQPSNAIPDMVRQILTTLLPEHPVLEQYLRADVTEV
jgi:hypothetical protein